MIPVKICGITNIEDARCALEAGASAVGFIFYEESARAISPDSAANIADVLPSQMKKVGVFVNHHREFIEKTFSQVPLDLIQLHGGETAEFCSGFSVPVIKVLRVKHGASMSLLNGYDVHALLLDTWKNGQYGGTGKTFDWSLLKDRTEARPIILSGGLKPENVLTAVETVRPAAIDVNSGVEVRPGIKDHDKIRSLFREIEDTHSTGFHF